MRQLASEVDLLLVVGAANSSNSVRLCEVAAQQGLAARLIEAETDIDPSWLDGVGRVGVTAGASAPEALVQKVLGRLRELGANATRELDGVRETITFNLPKLLQAGVPTKEHASQSKPGGATKP